MLATKPNVRISLKSIAFPTDFSEASAHALAYALALARWYGSKLFVTHIVPPEPRVSTGFEPLPIDLDSLWKDARAKLDDFLLTHPLQGIPHEVVMRQGDLAEGVAFLLSKNDIDLVVVGSHGRGGLSKLVLGSTAELIFRTAPCPVLTVGPKVSTPPAEPLSFKRILFATDFSAGSLQALPYAISLAEENAARLILAHFTELVPPQHQPTIDESYRRRLQALLPPDVADWCTPELVVRFEFPPEGILRLARDCEADLIVMGVHKVAAPRASAHMPWATAYEVVCNAGCPVLTVRG